MNKSGEQEIQLHSSVYSNLDLTSLKARFYKDTWTQRGHQQAEQFDSHHITQVQKYEKKFCKKSKTSKGWNDMKSYNCL